MKTNDILKISLYQYRVAFIVNLNSLIRLVRIIYYDTGLHNYNYVNLNMFFFKVPFLITILIGENKKIRTLRKSQRS